jgi:hypothetical protein
VFRQLLNRVTGFPEKFYEYYAILMATQRCTLNSSHSTTACGTVELNPLNAELNPICHLLAFLGAHHIFHVSGLRVNEVGA